MFNSYHEKQSIWAEISQFLYELNSNINVIWWFMLDLKERNLLRWSLSGQDRVMGSSNCFSYLTLVWIFYKETYKW